MKKLKSGVAWLVGILLVLGFATCVLAGLCDQKPGRAGRMMLAPRP